MKPALRVLFWLVVAASLLANAVVLGIFLRFGELRNIANGGGGGFANLPPPIKQEFNAVLRENRESYRAPLRALGAARRAMFAAAAARPYDRTAVQAAMERVRTASADMQIAGQALLLQAFDNAAAAAGP
jgi:uncharacterized membrane protein